jgi:hypothetical protein
VLKQLADLGVQPREEPTNAAVRKALREMLAAGEASTLWLYWSGHGVIFGRDREALLCSDNDVYGPSYIYLSEFRDELRSEDYRQFTRQRLIIDACAQQVTYEDLGIKAVRPPLEFPGTLACDQTVWSAVPAGEKAEASQGSSLFTRNLLAQLKALGGWPDDIQAFYKSTATAVAVESPDSARRPRLRIASKNFEDGLLLDNDVRAAECRLMLDLLSHCKIDYDLYLPHYRRTIGKLSPDPKMSGASTLTAMVQVLVEARRDAAFGGFPRPLVEFFSRVVNAYPAKTDAIKKWIDDKVPPGAQETIATELAREKPDLALALLLVESLTDNGFPVKMSASLTDAGFAHEVQTWPVSELPNQDELQAVTRAILLDARALALKQNVKLAVHILANPPLLGVPYQAFTVKPADKYDTRAFGQFHPFFLRSRARLQLDPAYDIEGWREKLKALRNRKGSDITFHCVSGVDDSTFEKLAKLDGLLWIREVVGAVADTQALLRAALECGLPLVSWRVTPPENDDWEGFEKKMKGVFEKFAEVCQAPWQFRDERKSEAWARQTALLWDDDDVGQLREFLGEKVTEL